MNANEREWGQDKVMAITNIDRIGTQCRMSTIYGASRKNPADKFIDMRLVVAKKFDTAGWCLNAKNGQIDNADEFEKAMLDALVHMLGFYAVIGKKQLSMALLERLEKRRQFPA